MAAYTWTIEQNFRRWLYEIQRVSGLDFEPSYYHRMYGMDEGSLCNLDVPEEAWPPHLKEGAGQGNIPRMRMSMRKSTRISWWSEWTIWISGGSRETPMQAGLLKEIDRLFEFESELRKRVQERETISLLD